MKNDDDIGYGNPPKHSQFKKGQSGNPSGRPKKKVPTNMVEIFNEILDEPATMKVGNKVIKTTWRVVFLNSLLKRGLEKEHLATKLVFEMMKNNVTSEQFQADALDEALLLEFADQVQEKVREREDEES
jgi:hypothetical protein